MGVDHLRQINGVLTDVGNPFAEEKPYMTRYIAFWVVQNRCYFGPPRRPWKNEHEAQALGDHRQDA